MIDSPFTSKGLVRELSEVMYKGVPSEPDWPETLACSLVALIAGKERYIMDEYGALYFNLMCLYIGGSGIAFKTVPLKKYMRPLIEALTRYVNEEVVRSYGLELDDYKDRLRQNKQALSHERKTKEWREERSLLNRIEYHTVEFLALERFTTEKLTNWLTQYPQGIIVGDEYTKTFKGARQKDYLSDNMEDLSRLADCDLGKVGTISRGVEYPEHAFISFVSATTYYLLKLMDDDFFIQGQGIGYCG